MRGYRHVNMQIFKIADKLNGKYVYVLDDDDYIINMNFVRSFKQFLSKQEISPPVVICKGFIDEKPFPKVWQAPLNRGQIGSPNFITRNDIFKLYAKNWVQDRAGDWHFISACSKHENFCWWDKIIFKAE